MGWKGKFFGIGILLFAIYAAYDIYKEKPLPHLEEEFVWGPEAADESIVQFKVNVPEVRLDALREDLERAKYADSLADAKFHYGVNSKFLRQVVKYWKDEYSWKQWEDKINEFPQYQTVINGLHVHFLHVKGTYQGLKDVTVLMTHGWPGSFFEFYKAIPLIQKHGKAAGLNVNMVVPSIPGYGFSQAPTKQGFTALHCGVLLKKLMLRLGYTRFFVQGGDWGALVAQTMTNMYPDLVIGHHTNMPSVNSGPWFIPYQMFVATFPTLVMEGKELEAYNASPSLLHLLWEELGYFHLQSTKPDTVGAALLNSPVGLAAYILEKFSTWTQFSNRALEDGGIPLSFSLDEVLTNVMIYWATDSITSSMRLYKETVPSSNSRQLSSIANRKVPTAVLAMSGELRFVPKCLATTANWNIVQYTASSGGHFAAFEKPETFSEDVVSFLRIVMQNR